MTKKNEFDFSVPHRLPWISILYFAYRALWRLFNVFIYIVIFILNRLDFNFVFLLLLIPALIVYSYFYYRRFIFYLEGDEIILEKGVFSRQKLSINKNRVQVVNLEQGIFHQIFDVYKLKVETAGSGQAEFVLSAIEEEKARALKSELLKGSKVKEQTSELTEEEKKSAYQIHLKISELFQSALLSNPFPAIIAALFFIYTELGQSELVKRYIDIEGLYHSLVDNLPIVYLMLTFATAVFVAYIIQVLIRILQFWNFHLIDHGKNFQLEYGLLTRVDNELRKSKLQVVEWRNNVLSRMLGFSKMKFFQATPTDDVRSRKVLSIPYIHARDNKEVLERSMDFVHDPQVQFHPHPIFGWRMGFLIGGIYTLIVCGIFFLTPYKEIIWTLLMLLPIAAFYYDYWKYCVIEIGEEFLKIKIGRLSHSYRIGKRFKAQSVVLKQSIFQKPRNIATLIISYASGEITIPDIDHKHALEIYNDLLRKVESTAAPWM